MSYRIQHARNSATQRRAGAISVLAAFCLIIMMIMAAFAVDLGYLAIAKADLQRSADAAAQSAVLEYQNNRNIESTLQAVRDYAKTGVESNPILRSVASVDLNHLNADPKGDIVLGRISFSDPRSEMQLDSPESFNAVRVRVRRTKEKNGSVSTFFGRVIGIDAVQLEASATAAVIRNVAGFRITARGENVPFLPITVSESYWNASQDTESDDNDNWAYDPEADRVYRGQDDKKETVLFPNRTSSGNFGTVNIGTDSNSTSALSRQIRNGLDHNDLANMGGELRMNEQSRLILPGNPGLSSSVSDDLKRIRGEVRIIPIYRTVTGTGSNAEYVIVRFEAVRIMAVELSSNEKYVAIQPAQLRFSGVIQSGTPGTSQRIYSPLLIVQ